MLNRNCADTPQATFTAQTKRRLFVNSLLAYYLSCAVVLLGVLFGMHFIQFCTAHPDSMKMDRTNFAEWFGPWDSVWFRQIVETGYRYSPDEMSNVAFYPLYPASAWCVGKLFGLASESSLLLTSHLFLVGAYILVVVYMLRRSKRLDESSMEDVLLSMSIFPTVFYFRMSYTESTLFFFLLLALVSLESRWPLWISALIVGTATAARPVGVALVLPLIATIWLRRESIVDFCKDCCLLLPLSVWGITSFIAYQWFNFGEPLAFAKTQIHWYMRVPTDTWQLVKSLLILEPFWSVYMPSSDAYWRETSQSAIPIFSMSFMNPIFVLMAWAAVVYGAIKRWLTVNEILLCIGLFSIPYVTHAYRSCMTSEARYAAVVFPIYIVMGKILSQLPPIGNQIFITTSCILMFVYSAMFTNWYAFF